LAIGDWPLIIRVSAGRLRCSAWLAFWIGKDMLKNLSSRLSDFGVAQTSSAEGESYRENITVVEIPLHIQTAAAPHMWSRPETSLGFFKRQTVCYVASDLREAQRPDITSITREAGRRRGFALGATKQKH